MPIEKGPQQPPQGDGSKPESNIIDFAEAKKRLEEKNRATNSEQREPSPDFEREKREFLEKTRESLDAIRNRSERQRAEMKALQDAIDRRRELSGGIAEEEKTTQETLFAASSQNIDAGFATLEENLELAEQADYPPDLFDEVQKSFEESLRTIEESLDYQEKTLGRIPQKELDAMPEIVRREMLHQQQVAETFPDDSLKKLDEFRQRLDLIKGFVNPDAIRKIENAISAIETNIHELKLLPGLKRLGCRLSLETTMTKIDQAIRGGEEHSKKRR